MEGRWKWWAIGARSRQHPGVDIHLQWLDRTETVTTGSPASRRALKVGGDPSQVASPTPQVDAGENYLAVATRSQKADLLDTSAMGMLRADRGQRMMQ